MDITNQQEETDAQGFDEDGPHWRLRPLLQSLSGLPALAKLGKSYPPNCLWEMKPLRLNVQALQVVKRTLEPVWKEDWDVVVEEAMDQRLDLDMWDKDHVGADEFMGRASFPLSKLTDNGKTDQWVRIQKLTFRGST